MTDTSREDDSERLSPETRFRFAFDEVCPLAVVSSAGDRRYRVAKCVEAKREESGSVNSTGACELTWSLGDDGLRADANSGQCAFKTI
jgi:hypothetical protein